MTTPVPALLPRTVRALRRRQRVAQGLALWASLAGLRHLRARCSALEASLAEVAGDLDEHQDHTALWLRRFAWFVALWVGASALGWCR